MSLFAGIYAFDDDGSPSDADVEAIVDALSRSGDETATYRDDRLFLAKLDLGLFGEPAFAPDRPVAAGAGEMLLDPRPDRACSRVEDLDAVRRRLAEGDVGVLLRCQGSFGVCTYDPVDGSLTLATDRVGIRPVYYHFGPDRLVFAGNLRVLESMPSVTKVMDLRGVTETAVLGFPLGERTPYHGIGVLRGGEVLRVRGRDVVRSRYFRLADVPATTRSREALLSESHDTFLEALACRSARDTRAVSFLSGGLDSRVVVAGLRELGKTVYTLTYESPGRKDAVIARQFAERIGSCHTTRPAEPGTPQQLLKARAVREFEYVPGDEPCRPGLVFSGDGGSVGLGFVYMEEPVVRVLRDGTTEDLLRHLRADRKLPGKVFREDISRRLRPVIASGIREELAIAGTSDPLRRYHIYLMDNDQRRHLHYLHEDVDRNRIELMLPFFDGRFVELVASAPVDWFLLHRFYNDWLQTFPEPVTTVPWQAYPGHVPCPVTETDSRDRRTQWQRTRSGGFRHAGAAYRQSLRAFVQGRFPGELFRRGQVAAGLLAHGLRVRNYGYVWSTCNTFRTYFERCCGRVAPPDPDAP